MTAPTDVRPPDDDRARIVLPPATGSTRALARRRRRQQRRRRGYLGAGVAVVVVVGLVATLLSTRPVDKPEAKATPAAAAVPHVPRLLLVHQGADTTVRSMAVLAPGREESAVLLLAPSTMAEVTSLGLEPLSVSLGLGGADRLRASVENLLGVEVEQILVLDDAGIVELIKPLEPVPVDIPTRLESVASGGQVDVLYEPGVVEVTADEAPRLLSRVGTEPDLALVARHQAFWQALLARIKKRPAALSPSTTAVAPGRAAGEIAPAARLALLQTALKRMVSSDTKVKIVPVNPIGRGGDDGDEELYAVDEKALRTMLLATFPADAERLRQRIRVQILNGTGELELAPRVAAKLVPAGARISLTGNANRFNFEQTQVVFYDRNAQAKAERVLHALGVGRLVLSRVPLGVVDVTVIVGKDFSQS